MLGHGDVGETAIVLNFGEGQNRLPRESTRKARQRSATLGRADTFDAARVHVVSILMR